MSVVKMDDVSFTVCSTFRGTEMPEVTFEYQLFVGTDTAATALGLWAIRNGVSQAMVDCMAGCKDVDSALEAWTDKANALLAGKVPTSGGGGGPRVTPLENECRAVMALLLTQAGRNKTEALKIAKDWRAYLSDLAREKAAQTGGDQPTLWKAACERIEAAAKERLQVATPSAEGLV